jgi:hypothetical protein
MSHGGISAARRSIRPIRLVPAFIGPFLALLLLIAIWRTPRDLLIPFAIGIMAILVLALMGWAIAVLPASWHPSLTDEQLNGLAPKDRLDAQNDRRERQDAARTVLLQAIGGAAVLAGLIFTWMQFRADQAHIRADQARVQEQLAVAQQHLHLTQQGQSAEWFTRAIQQLGDTESRDVHLGGIYTLERLAKTTDDHNDRHTVYEVLTAFTRNHAPWKPRLPGQPRDNTDPKHLPTMQRWAPDVQASLTVLGRRDYRADDPALDLHGTDLRRTDLADAHLERARLDGAHLERAWLPGAHLQDTGLTGAHLQRATLDGAHLERARLTRAHLEGAQLDGAHLEGASLDGANLEGAWLAGAHLEGAIANDATTWPSGFDWRKAGVRQLPTALTSDGG